MPKARASVSIRVMRRVASPSCRAACDTQRRLTSPHPVAIRAQGNASHGGTPAPRDDKGPVGWALRGKINRVQRPRIKPTRKACGNLAEIGGQAGQCVGAGRVADNKGGWFGHGCLCLIGPLSSSGEARASPLFSLDNMPGPPVM